MFETSLTTIVIIVLVILLLACSIVLSVKRNSVYRQLEQLLGTGDYDAFFELIDKPLTRYLYPDFNLAYFKLNAYMIKGDFDGAIKTLEDLLAMKASKKQRRDLVIKAFNLYIGQDMGDKAKQMLDEIDSWDGNETLDSMRSNCHQIYEINVLGETKYISDMEKQLQNAKGAARGQLEYLLSVQYRSKGDTKRAEEYLSRAAEDSFGM